MLNDSEKTIPFARAIGYVLLSVLVIWGTLCLTWIVHRAVLKKRQNDDRYKIVALIQSSVQKETLKTAQLVELLGLSRDEPQNLYGFDPRLACEKLLGCPAIKKATCRRLPPGIVLVDYSLREPKAHLADFHNMAIDCEGFTFALMPYVSPKNLPEIYLGISDLVDEQSLDSPEATLAIAILDYCEASLPKTTKLIRIDTHSAYAKSAGLREVVIVVEESNRKRFLRLKSRDFEQSLQAYIALKETFDQLAKDNLVQVIDLRCPSIALIR